MTLTADQERKDDIQQGYNFPASTYTHPDYTYRLACLNQGLIYAPVTATNLNGSNFLPIDIFYPVKNKMFFIDGTPIPARLPAFIGANGREMVCNFFTDLWPYRYDVEKKLSSARNVAYTAVASTLGYGAYSLFPQKNPSAGMADVAFHMSLSFAFAAASLYAVKKLFNAKSADAERDATYAIRIASDRVLARQMLELDNK